MNRRQLFHLSQRMRTEPKYILSFLMVATGIFLSTMDSSMINVALPYIMKSFTTTLDRAEWVVLIYLLTITVSLLIWGWIADRIGKVRVYLAGMLLFAGGAFCCYLSSTLAILIASRLIQGLGAAMMMATGPAIIRMALPREQIGRWLGMLGIATSLGLMCGPLAGGFLIHHYSWRAIFLLNVPISLTAFLLGSVILAGTLPRSADGPRSFDWRGSCLWSVMIISAVLVLNRYNYNTILSNLGGITVVLLAALFLIRHEKSVEEPLFPVALLQRRYYRTAMITSAMSFTVLFMVLILMPFFLAFVQGLSSERIGYLMMSLPVTLSVVSPLAGRLFDRYGAKYLTSGGLFISGTAMVFLAMMPETATFLAVGWRLALLGCGQSVFLSPNSASVLFRVSCAGTGVTSGMLATSRNLGMLAGVALAGLIFGALFSFFSDGFNLGAYTAQHLSAFMYSFRITLAAGAAIAFMAALYSLQRE